MGEGDVDILQGKKGDGETSGPIAFYAAFYVPRVSLHTLNAKKGLLEDSSSDK